MNKSKNYINIVSLILIVVLVLSLSCFLIIKKSKTNDTPTTKDEIPQIKEEYETTILSEYSTYDTNIYLDDKSKEIILTSDEEEIDYYIIGKYGVMYINPISIEKEDSKEIETYGNYKIMLDEESEKYYYINSKSKIISDLYDIIKPIYFQNNICHYLLLSVDNQNYILNINTDGLTMLNEEIKDVLIDNDENKIGEDKYLIYTNQDDMYGLIDFEGNIILEASYDYLSPYNSSTTFIAKSNNKYGVINNENKTILNFEYKNISYDSSMNNYVILQKNNKLGIIYNNELIVNYTIEYNSYDIYTSIIKDDALYLNINSSKKNNKLYKISSHGIEKDIDGLFNPIYDYNDDLTFFYEINEYNDKLLLYIYDIDLYEYYNTIIEYKKQYDYIVSFSNLKDTYYYKMDIIYELDSDSEDQSIYIDLRNSKLLNEMDALYKYFDNGYAFTLDAKGNLNIYKKKELLSTYKNVTSYFGGYYFLSEKNNKYTIYKLEFKKETK